jgi:TonB-dependent receptor
MRSRTPSYRCTMLMSASALVVAFLAPTAALAADAADASTVEELVVTGQRAAIQSAQAFKQDAPQIVDSITATDIGALPDRSVTEALQRVPGITIGRTTEPRDADRLSVEGSGVQIRGISWVRGELNGRDSFSAKNGRSLSFEDIPPELMAGVDVYKNPAADIIEGGIGGTVNLRTRMPFDAEGRLFAVSADMSWGDLRKKWEPTASVLYSDRWNTPIGEIGLLVDLTHSKLAGRQDTISVDPFFVRTNLEPGRTVYVPGGFGYRRLDIDRLRQGQAAALQWRPNDRWETSFQFLRSKARLASTETAVGFDPGSGNGPAAGTSFTYDPGGFFQSGTIAGSPGGTGLSSSVIDARYAERTSITSDYSLHSKYDVTDRLSISGDIQYIRAKTKTFDFSAFNSISADASPATLDVTGSRPVITMDNDEAFFHDPSNYYLLAAMDFHDYNTAEEWAERVDLSYTFDDESWLKDFKFGVRNTYRRATTRETTFNWNTVAPSWNGSPSVNNISSLQGYEAVFPFNNYYRGKVNLPGSFIHPTGSLVNDFASGAEIIGGIAQQYGGGWRPFDGDYSGLANGGLGGGVNYQKEKTFGGYAVLNFGHDLAIAGEEREFDGNIGVRIVQTKASGTGSQTIQALQSGAFDLTAATLAQDVAFANGLRTPIDAGRDYWNVLPSLNLRLKITPELQLRFAAAKTITRPDFNQMQPFFNVSATAGTLAGGVCTSAQSGQPGNCVYQYTANGGNPELKPIRSTQFDVSLEWYFAPTGSLTVAAFHKDIYNFITNGALAQDFTNNGVTRSVLVTQPYNAGHGTVKGFEAAYQQYYDELPSVLSGLGMQANFTYIKSKGARNAASDPFDKSQTDAATTATASDLPLEGLSKYSYNVALLYDRGPVSARLAYNWRSRYLLTTVAANINIPAWYDNYGQLDASVFYAINDHLKVGVQGVNLANSESRILVSYPGHPEQGKSYHNWVQTDRRYSVVLRATF